MRLWFLTIQSDLLLSLIISCTPDILLPWKMMLRLWSLQYSHFNMYILLLCSVFCEEKHVMLIVCVRVELLFYCCNNE